MGKLARAGLTPGRRGHETESRFTDGNAGLFVDRDPQLAEDGGHPVQEAEGDDPRLVSIDSDLAALEQASDGDVVIEELAAKYWVP
ncbi:MAG: hypothetical protein EOP28_00470 [Rhodococcus sp. (in: high G+C Gram-positive bacteria)]|nr:MAG: hypothetical protein EOP28_00470 [Rhodococcus sp. (in: high G+C Gram-positive bacteria)]